MGLLDKEPSRRWSVDHARAVLREMLSGTLSRSGHAHADTDVNAVVRPPPGPPPAILRSGGQVGGRAMLDPDEPLTGQLARLQAPALRRSTGTAPSRSRPPRRPAAPGRRGGADREDGTSRPTPYPRSARRTAERTSVVRGRPGPDRHHRPPPPARPTIRARRRRLRERATTSRRREGHGRRRARPPTGTSWPSSWPAGSGRSAGTRVPRATGPAWIVAGGHRGRHRGRPRRAAQGRLRRRSGPPRPARPRPPRRRRPAAASADPGAGVPRPGIALNVPKDWAKSGSGVLCGLHRARRHQPQVADQHRDHHRRRAEIPRPPPRTR